MAETGEKIDFDELLNKFDRIVGEMSENRPSIGADPKFLDYYYALFLQLQLLIARFRLLAREQEKAKFKGGVGKIVRGSNNLANDRVSIDGDNL